MTTTVVDGIMRLDELTKVLGLSKSTIWRRIRQGEFPPPIRLGGEKARAVGWPREVVREWLNERESIAA